jgi:hypothetical protein
MNEMDFIQQLASRARMETHPSVDVSNRVMLALNNRPEQIATFYRPLVWMAGSSVLVAIFAGVMTFATYQPVVYLLESLYFNPSLILL